MSEKKERLDEASEAKPVQDMTGRRDFIAGAGKMGISTGLAYFLLVGGKMQEAAAADDNCPSPYTPTAGDKCEEGNKDECVINNNTGEAVEYGDQCLEHETHPGGDKCWLMAGVFEVGDECHTDWGDNDA